MKKILLSAFCTILLAMAYGQVGINILIPDSSAVLQLESNRKGLGLPRLSTAQMNAIQAPLNGLTIYNTSDSVVMYYNGQCWLKAYEPNCYYCDFQMTINHPSDTLDRTLSDSVVATVSVAHTHGTGPVMVTWSTVPPPGVNIYTQGSTTIDSSGSFNIVVAANVFSGSGDVPILITAYCGDQAHFLTYNVYIKPCVIVNIVNDYSNYDVQALNSSLLPAGSTECLVVNVAGGVTLHSDTNTMPALTIGNLNPNSICGIINQGAMLGRGGNGAGFALTTVGGNPGDNGGNALNLTTRTIIQNTGEIYAGGGGGGSIGLSYSSPSLPIVGTITLGFGVGGGGGSESGLGGATPGGGITLGFFRDGSSATSSIYSVPGSGGAFTAAIPISTSIAGITVTITITPNVVGGNGGGFAQAGGAGSASVSLSICLGLPIIGTICPVSLTLPVPIGGSGGSAGMAIKRNGNPLSGIADGSFYGFQIKGNVGP